MSHPVVYTYTAGEDIGPGRVVYIDPLNEGEVKICTDGTIATAQQLAGITAYGADSGDPIDVVMEGEVIAKSGITFGATVPYALTCAGGAGGVGPALAGTDQIIAYAVGNISASAIGAADVDIKVRVVPAINFATT